MAAGKKFYWIKLRTSFLDSEKIDFLLSQKNYRLPGIDWK